MTTLPPSPALAAPGLVRCDVAIVGAGVAGLYAAALLPVGLDVCVVDKGVPGSDSGSSPWAQGGIAAALGPDDAPERHAEDTLVAGDGLCDPVAVRVLAEEAPDHIARLLSWGAQFDRRPGLLACTRVEGLHLAREGGHQVARCVHRADASGAELVRVLREAAGGRVSRLPAIARALLPGRDGRVAGVDTVTADGDTVTIAARAVLLATGGCGGLFAATTNPEHATGDGLALAAAAGAAVRDSAFVQFHPTGLAVTGSWRFLLTEALRGAGGTLHDADGHRFLVGRHPLAELAPRHVVAKAILEQAQGRAWLDATHLSEAELAREFPTVLAGARRHGFDLATERVPVTPAAHYLVGGVRTDLRGRTSLAGLYAAGEVASTGVHGANRLAGNSLSESLVFAARAAAAIAAELGDAEVPPPPALESGREPPADDRVAVLRRRLRAAMWEGAGPVRSAAGLEKTAGQLAEFALELDGPPASPGEVELTHALRAATIIVAGALLRPESRGGHQREDHAVREPAWDGVHIEQTAADLPG